MFSWDIERIEQYLNTNTIWSIILYARRTLFPSRFAQRVRNHNGRDMSTRVYKHFKETYLQFIECSHFKILRKIYENKKKRKFAKALLIKNVQRSTKFEYA